ncbi:hypothetical protein LH95_07970 [Staphylococcus schleiferi]|nr:hypothetical protein LH95_07970 [Staphylococcus schleiferi]
MDKQSLMYQITIDAILQQVKLIQKEIVLTIMVSLAKHRERLLYMGSICFFVLKYARITKTS